ncbi:High affinity Ca2+/Mn2+ P-type ATPase-like protein, partial [Coemansia sp. RSA 2524]
MPVAIHESMYPPQKSELPRGALRTTSEYALEDSDAVLNSLCTDAHKGLASHSIRQRQDMYGLNTLEASEEEGLLMKFVKSIVTNSMVMLLLGSAGVSVLVGNWDDASLEALASLVPNYCHVVRDDELTKLLADYLVPGDIVKFATGDRIPADVRIVVAHHLEVDESALTGESESLTKTPERVVLPVP